MKKGFSSLQPTCIFLGILILIILTNFQWCSRTFGRLVRWSNFRPIVLGFGKWIACLKPRILPKVTCSIYSILVSS